MALGDRYATDVFVNCPFDDKYRATFAAIVFSIFDCGFRPRCALELDDSGEVRIEKLFRIIESCRFGIHDLTRTELDAANRLPRFNMPLELGLFLAAQRFGDSKQKRKRCLILDREPYRYQKFISDIAGQDIQPHGNSAKQAIRRVRDWLHNHSSRETIPSGIVIHERYATFQRELPRLCKELRLHPKELTYKDYGTIVSKWLLLNA